MSGTSTTPLQRSIGAAALVLCCTAVQAAVTPFGITYDGTTVSVDAGSATPAGTVLAVGDGFDLDLHASGTNFWTLNAAYSSFVPLTFFVLTGGDRTADITTEFLLDGITQLTMTENDVAQSEVHIGAQSWNLSAGLMFDQIKLSWTMDSSTASTTIQPSPGIFSSFGLPSSPFYNDARFAFGSNAVPLPGTLPLIGLALALLATLGRRARRG